MIIFNLVISIVIDYDRGHCYEHLKRTIYDENWACGMHVFECLCVGWIFELPEMGKTLVYDFSGQTCLS